MAKSQTHPLAKVPGNGFYVNTEAASSRCEFVI